MIFFRDKINPCYENFEPDMLNTLVLKKTLIDQKLLKITLAEEIGELIKNGAETAVRSYSVKKMFLKISKNSQENTCTRVSFLIKLQSSACNFIKQESRTQVFSCEICETFKKTFLYRTLWWQRFNIVCQSKHYEYYPRMSFFTQEIDFLIFSRSIERGW